MHTTSASLLYRLRTAADEEAWARFVRLYTPLLYTWARRLPLPSDDAADLVQEVLTTLVRKLPSFEYDRGQCFRAWLRTVTLNQWRNLRRRRTAVPVGELRAAGREPDAPDPILEIAEAEYRQQLVGRALRLMQTEFEPTTWRACWEHVVSGRPAAAVAAELGMSEGAVYVAKCRVMRRLRQELEGLLD